MEAIWFFVAWECVGGSVPWWCGKWGGNCQDTWYIALHCPHVRHRTASSSSRTRASLFGYFTIYINVVFDSGPWRMDVVGFWWGREGLAVTLFCGMINWVLFPILHRVWTKRRTFSWSGGIWGGNWNKKIHLAARSIRGTQSWPINTAWGMRSVSLRTTDRVESVTGRENNSLIQPHTFTPPL